MKRIRILSYVLTLCTVLTCISLYLIGSVLVSPKPVSVGEPPQSLPFKVVRIPRGDGNHTRGWFAKNNQDLAGVLLLHGVRSDRRQMVERSRFLFEAGYSVLLIDMQAHGETPGEFVTFGYRESIDVHKALEFLRVRVEGRPAAVIGASMGGAAILLGDHPVRADAVVLEGVFATLEHAIENRIAIRLGSVGRMFAPLLSLQLEPRLGISPTSVSPASAISNLYSPVLIMSGTEDQHALPVEAQVIYDNANQPKLLWLVEGAKHEDLHRYAKKEYEQKVLDFLSKSLN